MSDGLATSPDATANPKCFNCAKVAVADGDADAGTAAAAAARSIGAEASTSRCEIFKQLPAGTTIGARLAAPVCFAIALQLATTGEMASGYADSAAHANAVVICPINVFSTYPRCDGRIGVHALNALLNAGASAAFNAEKPARTMSEQPGTCVS